MATQFDATARINVDLRGFSQAANEVTRSGGSMTKIFQNLHVQLNQLEATNKKVSADLLKLLSAFNQISSAAQKYASAMQALSRIDGSKGPQQMAKAFDQLRTALANVNGMSAKEAERVGRTVNLYNQLASALQKVARSYQIIRSVGQMDVKQAQTAERNAQAAARLAIEQQRVENAAQRAANAQRRLNAELERSNHGMRGFGQSSFAVRSSLGEIEQQGRGLLQVFQAIGTTLAGSAISQEQAFAQVTRVVSAAAAEAAGLKDAFQAIAADMPISFEEVARIGQLGAQIGVTANQLDAFTQTVARFSLTTGVAAEETTLLLGRIAEMQQVPTNQMENLGSAILALGTASAATEQEILRINESIATVSNVFGLSAPAVTGLASALATLRVRPELARGSLTRVFGELDSAIQDGGQSLGKLASLMNMTGKEVVNLRNTNPDQFFLAFVRGLKGAAQESGGFQTVLRDLGINAVRDIDTFTRLGNNFEVLSKSFASANLEWSKGTELQRQSEDIFDTTAARLQNLSDEFKNFAAQAGGPLAAALGTAAKALSQILEWLTSLGPVVPIFGALTAVVVAGGAAFVAYQLILSKTIQSLIATSELQRNLGVSTLTIGTAFRAMRGELAATAGASANLAGGLRLANSEMTVGQAAAERSALAIKAQGAAAQQTAIAMGRTVAANEAAVLSWSQMAAASTESSLAMRGVVASTGQAARANELLAGSTFASSQALQRQAVAAGEAAAANRILTSTSQQAASAGLAGAAGITALGRGAQAASLGARAAALAFGPWGIAILGVTTILGPMIASMVDFRSESEKLYESSIKAAGGTQGLVNAIKADTEEFKKSGDNIRVVRNAYSGLSTENDKLANRQLNQAQAQKRAIEATAGNRAELERQAAAHGKGAEAAQVYLSKLDDAEGVIKRTNAALAESTVAIGAQTKMWLTNATEAALSNSKLADGSKLSKTALDQLGDSGVKVGDILTKALRDPETATGTLDDAIKDLNKTIDMGRAGSSPGMLNTEYGKSLVEQAAAATRAKDFLEALRQTIGDTSDEALKASTVQDLLGDALQTAGQEAVVAGGKIKLTSDNLEDLDQTAESAASAISNLGKSLQGFGTPLDAFASAAKKAMGDSEKSVEKFSLSAKGNLNTFLRELEKIAQAQQNWSANLIKISGTLGADITQGLAELGPEAAPMIQQLAQLTTGELQKLKPRLAALGAESTEALAGGLLKGIASLENVSAKARNTIATGLSKALKDADNPEDFNKIVASYDKMITELGKKKPKIDIEVALDAVKAGADIGKLMKTYATADKLKIRPEVDVLFDQAKTAADFNRIATIVETLASAKKAKIPIDMDDAPAKASIIQLEAWVRLQEVMGLLDVKGKAAMEDGEFRSKVTGLANLVLGEEATGKFDVNGDGKFNDTEFRALFQALINFVLGNESKLDAEGKAELEDLVTNKLGGIIKVMNAFNGKTVSGTANLVDNASPKIAQISTALSSLNGRTATAYANTVQTTYRRQIDQGSRSVQAASGGYITGPGGPRDDKISAWLSNGEFVVNAAATKKHRALLEKINARGAKASVTQPFHYANGGMVQGGGDRQSALMMQRAAASMNTAASTLVGQVSRNADRKVQMPRTNMGPVITVNNTYPRDEPTSISINRSLAYAAALNGTL